MMFKILTAISALISLLLTIHAFYMKHSKYTVIFAMLMSEITIFTLGSNKELMVNDITGKVLWRTVSQTGFLLVVPTILILIIIYIGKENNLKPIIILEIYFFPVLAILLKWTDPYYHLMRKYIYLDKGNLVVISTPFALFIMLLELNIILISLILLFLFYKKINAQYKKQTLTMGIGILIPLIASFIKVVRPDLEFHAPLIAVTFTITGIILFWSIFRYQLFSIVPIARDKIFEIVQEGIITVDKYGVIIDKNNAADKFIYDTTGENRDLIGEKLEDFLINWPRWYQSCKNMMRDEFEIDTLKWGRIRYYYVKVYPIFKSNRKKRGTVSVLIDITDRKIREEELRDVSELNKLQLANLSGELSSQKVQMGNLLSDTEQLKSMNALKDKLFTVFTHDIRNPIATMVSLVDILEQDNDWYNTDCKEILEEVKKQINYTYNIIENLLEWLNSQREGLVIKPSLWNLTEILEETISMYLVSAGVKKISISCNVDDKLTIFADKEVLELVLRNLLSNAIKFTESGGNIWVEAHFTTEETIISVKDSGIGMDKDKVSQLFDEGYVNSTLGTAGEKGIGLGLLICKEFIMKGGGKIWAESKQGVGSTFYISLLNSNKKLS
ncbi:PAS domain S-box protein [Anaerocolumna sedimenticola]|uniref:histidine kinase n=1 Tax=Anaerocolumna sedimenticola TaxID=2696063 RepID=A0A6P1TPC1_9FIRM|nr:histidine kinase N-terminal 7TM domain-containing protein [Anaerocolumna sedimenticola]QHQ61238.1 PAS domain S-box protein [Anaerocolumna sedimenticola]